MVFANVNMCYQYLVNHKLMIDKLTDIIDKTTFYGIKNVLFSDSQVLSILNDETIAMRDELL